MKEVTIFGGSFNPPTRAHEAIARACLNVGEIDEVWLMPSGDRRDKRHGLSDTDRLWMLDLMHEEVFDADERLKISRFELDYLPRPTQTYQTVEMLTEHYPDHNFKFVFGADSYESMPGWTKGQELQRSLGMLIVPRSGVEIPPAANLAVLDIKACDLSSTVVRQAVSKELPIGQMVCDSVADYIAECGLYR